MQNDDIDEMFTSATPRHRSRHWRGVDAESSRALTEISASLGRAGHFDDHLGDSFYVRRRSRNSKRAKRRPASGP
jgi:hypothetical protein